MRFYEVKIMEPDALKAVRLLLSDAKFKDGRSSAGPIDGPGKMNSQYDRAANEQTTKSLDALFFNSLQTNPRVATSLIPFKLTAPRFARYNVGDEYPSHNDNPLMTGPFGMVRTDISMTLFLSEPDSYAGGELQLWSGSAWQSFKLPAGHAVFYPTGFDHRVTPVVSGVREVAVCWIQSRVGSLAKRELLDDVGEMVETLAASGEKTLARRADNIYGNLLRMWAE